ncbi:MAG: hypothetical protein RLZZ58_2272 [Pseudomonadota bacterium]|jgi:hypothetical protein
MELDEASQAVGRLERALSRIERVLVERSSQPVDASTIIGVPPARHDALRSEVTAVIAQLDGLIATASRG